MPARIEGGNIPWQLRRAVALGIRKVNIASDLNRVFVQTMAQALQQGEGYFWHAPALGKMKQDLQAAVREHLRVLGASGKARLYQGYSRVRAAVSPPAPPPLPRSGGGCLSLAKGGRGLPETRTSPADDPQGTPSGRRRGRHSSPPGRGRVGDDSNDYPV